MRANFFTNRPAIVRNVNPRTRNATRPRFNPLAGVSTTERSDRRAMIFVLRNTAEESQRRHAAQEYDENFNRAELDPADMPQESLDAVWAVCPF